MAVELSGAMRASAASGQSFTISSAWGKRLALPKDSRGSTRIVRKPSVFASDTSAIAMCTPPTITRRGAGRSTSTKISRSPAGSGGSPRTRAARASAEGGRRRCAPATGPSSKSASFRPSASSGSADDRRDRHRFLGAQRRVDGREEGRVEPIHEDVERSAAGEAHAPGRVVRDAVVQKLGLAARERLLAGLDDRVLDASARDRAGDRAIGRQGHLAARRPRAPSPTSRRPWRSRPAGPRPASARCRGGCLSRTGSGGTSAAYARSAAAARARFARTVARWTRNSPDA